MHLSSSLKIYSRICSAALFPVTYLPSVSKYIQTACGWERWEMLSRVGGHTLQEFYTLYLTRFRTYKIANPPQDKKRGPQTDNQLPQSPFAGHLTKQVCIAFYESYLSTL